METRIFTDRTVFNVFFFSILFMQNYLQPTYFLDSDHPSVIAYASEHTHVEQSPTEKAVSLYHAVRDGFWYNPYRLDFRPEGVKASSFLAREPKAGHCLSKGVLLAAAARAVGVPSRLSFYQVRNHLATQALERLLGTNLLVFHTAAELFLEERWVKATPAFNAALCAKLGVEPLQFTGCEDSIFQQYDGAGRQFMHYEHEYGAFDDLPFDLMASELRKYYGHVISEQELEQNNYVIDLQARAQAAATSEEATSEKSISEKSTLEKRMVVAI
jgi:transglutaminase-like putative cysteine protease